MEIGLQSHDLFATRIYAVSVADVVDRVAILEDVAELRRGGGSVEGSGTPGHFEWMSETDLQARRPFQSLVGVMVDAALAVLSDEGWSVEGMTVSECWATVSVPGGSHRSHTHPNSLLSAVWFASVPEGSGRLVFSDPRPRVGLRPARARSTPFTTSVVGVDPAEDLLVVFPSWLSHHVAPNTGAGERISVAANLLPTGSFGEPTARFSR